MDELRCGGTMHGRMLDDTHLEVKCGRRSCGHRPGTIVLHVFDLTTGNFTTRKFADPQNTRKESTRDASHSGTTVRAS